MHSHTEEIKPLKDTASLEIESQQTIPYLYTVKAMLPCLYISECINKYAKGTKTVSI